MRGTREREGKGGVAGGGVEQKLKANEIIKKREDIEEGGKE